MKPGFAEAADTLLDIPLVSYIFSNNVIPFHRRPIDARWWYHKTLRKNMSGFNPLSGVIHIPEKSLLASFIDRSSSSLWDDSDVNPDWLSYEVFYAIHDYLHSWVIKRAAPLFRTLTDPEQASWMLKSTLMLSEVAATVGLDFWYLSTNPQALGMGLECLTTTYKAGVHLDVDHVVNSRGFFNQSLQLYQPGTLDGTIFADSSLEWVEREGCQSQSFSRLMGRWIAYIRPTSGNGAAPNPATEDILRCFVREIRDDLWNAMRTDDFSRLTCDAYALSHFAHLTTEPTDINYLFRSVHAFNNWWSAEFLDAYPPTTARQFAYLTAQLVSSYDWHEADMNSQCFDALASSLSIDELRAWVEARQPLSKVKSTHSHVIFQN